MAFDDASARRTRSNDEPLEIYLKYGIPIYKMNISRFMYNRWSAVSCIQRMLPTLDVHTLKT